MLPETIGQLFVGGMDQPFSSMKVGNVVIFLVLSSIHDNFYANKSVS